MHPWQRPIPARVSLLMLLTCLAPSEWPPKPRPRSRLRSGRRPVCRYPWRPIPRTWDAIDPDTLTSSRQVSLNRSNRNTRISLAGPRGLPRLSTASRSCRRAAASSSSYRQGNPALSIRTGITHQENGLPGTMSDAQAAIPAVALIHHLGPVGDGLPDEDHLPIADHGADVTGNSFRAIDQDHFSPDLRARRRFSASLISAVRASVCPKPSALLAASPASLPSSMAMEASSMPPMSPQTKTSLVSPR